MYEETGSGPRNAAGQHGDDEQRHLVGHDEAEGPAPEANDGLQGLVVQLPAPAELVPVGLDQARHEGHALEDHAERGAEPEQDELGVVRLDAGQGGPVAGPEAEPDQDRDADDVVDDGRPGHGHKAPSGVEQRGAEGEQPVGGDLDHEPAEQPGGDASLEEHCAQVPAVRVGVERRERVDDPRSCGQGGQGGHAQDDHRHGEHGRDRLVGLALALVGQAVDEDGDERCREDPPQDDVVEHVGRRVGQVVGVGQQGLPQGPGQGHEAQQPGDTGGRGAHGDVDRRGPEGERAGGLPRHHAQGAARGR